MKKNILLLAIIILGFGLSNNLYGQIKISLLSGDVIETSEYKIDTTLGYSKIIYLTKKKLKTLETQDIFSIEEPQKGKTIFYIPQSKDELSVNDMQQLITGKNKGNEGRKFWIPFLITYTATTLTGFIEKGQIFIAPIVPLATTITIGICSKYEKAPKDFDRYIKEGYKDRRTFRRIKSSLIGAAAGLLSSLALHEIVY